MAQAPGSGRAVQFAYRVGQRLLQRAGRCGLRIHYVIALAPERLRLPPRLPRGLHTRMLEAGDAAALQGLRPPVGMAYGERFCQGHRCVGAFRPGAGGERLVAFVWLVRGPRRLPASFGCGWQIGASMAWLYDLYSDPGVLGAVPPLYAHLQQHLPGTGVRLLLGQTDFENLRSRLTHLSLGFEVLASLWSVRVGPWWAHFSHCAALSSVAVPRRSGARRWRWHGPGAAIPLPLLAARAGWAGGQGCAPGWRLQCPCGEEVELAGEAFVCPACGRVLGRRQGGVLEVGEPTPYWGEVSQSEMQALLRQAENEGWRAAVRQRLSPSLQAYVAAAARADFHELLPIAAGARVLDVGAGWGSIAAPLARHYEVLALEGVAERAQFIARRAREEGLDRLQVVCGNLYSARLLPRQFDAIVANGVLEWSALLDLDAPPRSVQLDFLTQLREQLRPRGCIYLAIENRCGWAALRGGLDHSGLPYTSLLPRWVAHRVCRRRYRAEGNFGYRTYTYTYRGYRRLFDEAGLRVAGCWISPGGYNWPSKLVPLHTGAIRFGRGQRTRSWWRRRLLGLAARAWVVRWLASDFLFLLRPAGEEDDCGAEGHREDRAHA
ncbi:MAG: class I SAM-dependent methyltransferase [Terriglobales bacterium]